MTQKFLKLTAGHQNICEIQHEGRTAYFAWPYVQDIAGNVFERVLLPVGWRYKCLNTKGV